MITVTATGDAVQQLKALTIEFPGEIDRAMGTAGSDLKGHIAKEMKAGAPAGRPIEALSPNTLALRRWANKGRKRKGDGKFGGKLPGLIRYKYDRSNGALQVGWIPSMVQGGDPTRAATRFMSWARHATTKEERYMFHRKNLILGNLYAHPERPVIDPYYESADTMPYVVSAAERRIRKIIEKRERSK